MVIFILKMPVNLGKKSYKNSEGAKEAVKRDKGLSEKRASAYVASVERAQGKDPRTGRR
ncbi:MAG: hypothetical protein WBX81_04250 [Nitrososphaeraceae archaeon]